MNILYTITWPDTNSEETPRQFYDQLRTSVAHGARFPYDCPYEIALVRASSTPDATPPQADWAVAVLANSVASDSLGDTGQTVPKLESWFNQYIPGGIQPGSKIHSAHATHLKLASELRPDYEIIANFGTFVGEPELELPGKPAESKPAQSVDVEPSKSGGVQSFAQAVEKLQPPPPPQIKLTAPQPAISNTFSTCLGLGMMITGVILVPVSLVLAALLAFGQFYSDPSTASTASSATHTSIGEFVLYLACCPLPILILGIGMVALGIFIPRWLKETQSLPVTPPKG